MSSMTQYILLYTFINWFEKTQILPLQDGSERSRRDLLELAQVKLKSLNQDGLDMPFWHVALN